MRENVGDERERERVMWINKKTQEKKRDAYKTWMDILCHLMVKLDGKIVVLATRWKMGDLGSKNFSKLMLVRVN